MNGPPAFAPLRNVTRFKTGRQLRTLSAPAVTGTVIEKRQWRREKMADGDVVRFRPQRPAPPQTSQQGLEDRLKGLFGSAVIAVSAFPGQHFFLEGDPASGIHIVRRGSVILYSITEAGGRHIQQIARAGDCFAVDFSHPHRLNAQALTEADTWHLPRRAVSLAVDSEPEARNFVFNLMDQQLRAARFKSELLSSRSAIQKCAAFLLTIEQPAGAGGEAPLTRIALKRVDIADYLGLTLETVSRMFNRLKKDGLIELPRHDAFRIADRARMNALARDLQPGEFALAS